MAHKNIDVTIAAGQSLSPAEPIQPPTVKVNALCGVKMPAAWTAASISLEGSCDGGTTYQPIFDADGDEFEIAAAAGRYIVIQPATLAGLDHIKVRSGISSLAVAQAADRAIRLVMIELD